MAAVLLLASLVVFRREVQFLFEKDPKVIAEVTENFNHGVVQRPDVLKNQGFVAGPNGWYIPPHTNGRLIYKSPQPVPSGGAVSLALLFYGSYHEVKNSVSLSLDGGKTFAPIAKNVNLLGARIDLASYLPSGGSFELLFEAENSSSSPVLVLDRMDLRIFGDRPASPPSPLRMTLAFLSFCFAIVLLTANWKRSLPFLFVLSAGFFIRCVNLERVVYTTLGPDAHFYRDLMAWMSLSGENGFYSGNFSVREPLFLLVGKVLFLVLGPSDTHLRLLSFFLSIGVILLVYRLAKELLGSAFGLFAASGIALNLPLILQSGSGLRLELEMVLLLVFCYVGFVKRKMASLHRFVLLGVVGGLIALTRSHYFPGLAFLMVAAALTHERSLKRVTLMGFLAVFLTIALLAPHQFMIYKRHGDPFWNTTLYARWIANMEFAGKPGFPTREEAEKDAFVGPKITYAEYLFKLHTPAEVLMGTLRGFLKIALRMNVVGYRMGVAALIGFDPGWVDHVVTTLGLLGLLVALSSPGFRWLPLSFLALTFHVAFLYDRGLVEPYRHSMQAFPFFLLSGLLALRCVWRMGLRWLPYVCSVAE